MATWKNFLKLKGICNCSKNVENMGDFIYTKSTMQINEVTEKITPILREYGIKKASVFGSVSRGDARSDSDVDLLVELGTGSMGLIKFIGLKHKLEDSSGKDVDLVTEGNINRHLEPYIRPELKTIYEG